MESYSTHKPTQYDSHIPLEGREHWLMVPCSRNRDSDALEESNFTTALKRLGGESDTVEVHRFGHWACGWYELIIVEPTSTAAEVATCIERSLTNYTVLDEDDWGMREQVAANEVWSQCYTWRQRIAYMRKHASEFECETLAEVLANARGKRFSGYASELVGR